jgi:DnaJ-class molecular chaperone
MTEEDRKILENLEQRQLAMDSPCPKCAGRGIYEKRICPDCVGQGVVLTASEMELIREFSSALPEDDSILDARTIE